MLLVPSHTPLALAVSAWLLAAALPARAQAQLLGDVSHSVADTLTLSPDGKRFAVVTVEPRTRKRRVIVDGKPSGKLYDTIATGMPLFSPDGAHVVFVGRRGPRCHVVLDGAEGEGYLLGRDGWPIADVTFSPHGKYLAYIARFEGKTRVVVGGEHFGPYEVSLNAEGNRLPGVWDFQFSPDGEHFAYRARAGTGMTLCVGKVVADPARKGARLSVSPRYESIGRASVVPVPGYGPDAFGFIAVKRGKEYVLVWAAGKEVPVGGPYEAVARGSLVRPPFAPQRLDYVVRKKGKWVVVAAGREESPYGEVDRLLYSADGRHAYAARKGKAVVLVVQGVESPPFDGVRYARSVFSPDGRSVAFAAHAPDGWRVVVNGQPGPTYGTIDHRTLTFSPEGKRLAYVASKGGKRFVVEGGKAGPEFDGVLPPRFSPDGRRLGYWARKGLDHVLVLDGEQLGPFASLSADAPAFSSDGKHLAYAALKDGQWQVFLDGKPAGPACEVIVSRLSFSGDGRLAYVVRLLDESGRPGYAFVAGGQAGRRYDAIWMGDGGRLILDPPATAGYFARRGPLVYRDAVVWPKGP
jgi:Tol biopolymer transport system component